MQKLYEIRLCKDCWHWKSFDDQEPKGPGECREDSPKHRDRQGFGICPKTAYDFWCGKFFPRKVMEGKKPDPVLPKG